MELQEVGNDALQIFWEDGHNAGIYKWETFKGFMSLRAGSTE
ncbi:DUF971 domain-containing protein [candidate division KSB1 bacterium]|nr:DUF971 domain-containing protein [candidate division KSB1 bacterium]